MANGFAIGKGRQAVYAVSAGFLLPCLWQVLMGKLW